jgi:hypothetical protein
MFVEEDELNADPNKYVVMDSNTMTWKNTSCKVFSYKLLEKVAWSYPNPTEAFTTIKDYVAFYPHQMDGCYVDGEKVTPQAGGFYGGWITSDIVGPFKGEPGTRWW